MRVGVTVIDATEMDLTDKTIGAEMTIEEEKATVVNPDEKIEPETLVKASDSTHHPRMRI